MNTKHLIVTIVIFVVLTITGISLIVFGSGINPISLVGSAIFASALTFFLIEMVGAYSK